MEQPELEQKLVTVEFSAPFKFAHGGFDVQSFEKGEVVSVPEECAKVAIETKVAKAVSAKKLDEAPENK